MAPLEQEKMDAEHADHAGHAPDDDLPVAEKQESVHNDPIFSDPDFRKKEKKVVRILDFTMLPMLWILYLFNYLDRTNVAQARLNTFDEDLGINGSHYSTAVAVLTAGYMAAQLPSNMLITRVRPGIYLPCCAFLWSGVSAATAFTTNFGSLVAVRFILGIVEAPLFPGAVFLMSCWYTRTELALRTAILYSGLVLAQAVSGLIAAGVFSGLHGVRGMAGWQWLFILEGAVGGALAIFAFIVLPDYPHSKTGSAAKWSMTEEQRHLALVRVQADRVSEGEADRSVWNGLKLAVNDYKTWLFIFTNIFMTSSYGFNNFFPTIVSGLGIGDRITSLLMTAPPYIVGAICSFLVAYNSDRTKERGYHITANVSLAFVGFVITVSTINSPARYAASFLYTVGSFSANALVYTWAVSTLSQTPEKRAAGGAIVNICGHIGNVISPYFFVDSQAPRYHVAFILMMTFGALTIIMANVLKVLLGRENKKLFLESQRTGRVYNPYTT